MNKKIVCMGNFNNFYGNVGEVTPFVIDGQYLQVGDVVSTRGFSGFTDDNFVVKDDAGKYFIMGLHGVDMTIKRVTDEWNVKLVKKYYEVKNREAVGSLILIDMDEENKTTLKMTQPSSNDKIEICEYDGTMNCEVCTNRAKFMISIVTDNWDNYDILVCPDCLADLGKKIIDVLR